MRSKPNPIELEVQLRAVNSRLEGVVQYDGDLEVSVLGEEQLVTLDEALSPASSPNHVPSPTSDNL